VGAKLGVLGVAFAVTFVLTPVVRLLAERHGAVVTPDDRRVHSVPTATIGGVAMYVALLVSMLVASQLDGFAAVFDSTSGPLGVLLAATVIFAVGLIDDLREVSAPARVAGMVLAGTILVRFGVSILFLRIPFYDLVLLSPDLSALITVLWVVGMANAVNLVDGLDGLAAGIVAIAAGSFFLYSEQLADAGVIGENNIGPMIALITLGICLGFLPHNFNPARVFMGDGGALLLGLLMAASTIAVGGSQNEPFSGQVYFFFAPLFIPLFILGVPIIDTVFAIIRRASRRSGVATADKEHLHHRLMRLGHGQRRAVLILWAWTAALSGLVLYPAYTGEGDAVVPLAVVVLGFGLYVFFHPGMRRNGNGNGAESPLPPREFARPEPED
jgi:UDP-GlcNAc:undecaprenyl-phosphate/decaprenyl-phosphate GlcNAc-1-phosphate transferase